MKHRLRLRDAQEGASAVEFALVLPIFILLLMGGFYAAFAAFTASNLHHAVEAGARCAAINKAQCSSTATTIGYVRTKLSSIGAAPQITVEDASCGKLVKSTVSFSMDLGLYAVAVPLSAQACYS